MKKSAYHRSTRPPYLHIIPLGEIIQKVLKTSSPNTKKCRNLYDEFIASFGCEISILADVSPAEIAEINPGIAAAIADLRAERVTFRPGGGGQYGTFTLPSLET